MRSCLRHAYLLLGLVISTTALHAAAQPTTRRWTIDGVTREAIVYVPESAKSKPSPLIFAFHGRGGKMQGAARLAFENAGAEAIVVYPQALKTPGLVADLEGKQFAWQERSIEIVRRINHCGDGEPWDGTTHCRLYPSPDGAPVIAYFHPGGHALPSDARAVIIKFFKQFPKPAAHSAQRGKP